MNYDVWGATDNPGANAPLSNACGDSQQPAASARAAIAAWKKAKMPASKITLGLPAYGYVSWSGNSKLVHKRDHIQEEPPRYKTYMEYWQAGRREQDARRLAHSTGQDVANSTSSSPALVKRAGDGDISAFAQSQIPWDQLISLGALTKNNKGAYVAANGFTRAWDDCSNTPYLYSQDKWQVVTYDDPTSIALKARYARGQKIGGFAFWDMTTDTSYTLMKAARAGWSIPDR